MAKKINIKKYIEEEEMRLIRQLILDGKRMIIKAYKTADFNKDRTQTLHDSYGSAVYNDGKLVPSSKQFFTARALMTGIWDDDSDSAISGRAVITQYLNNYKPQKKGLELVVCVAAFYGGIIENGQQPNAQKDYVVISGIADDMEDLARKYKGTVSKIGDF